MTTRFKFSRLVRKEEGSLKRGHSYHKNCKQSWFDEHACVWMHEYAHMSESLLCWSFYFLIFHIELPAVYGRFVYVRSYSLNKLINSFHFKYYLDIYIQQIYIFSPGFHLNFHLASECISNLIRPKLIYSPPSHFYFVSWISGMVIWSSSCSSQNLASSFSEATSISGNNLFPLTFWNILIIHVFVSLESTGKRVIISCEGISFSVVVLDNI